MIYADWIMVIFFLAVVMAVLLDWRRKPRRRLASGAITFTGPNGEIMSKLVARIDQTLAGPIVLSFLDKKENPTNPAVSPSWSLTSEGVVSLAVADDGMSAAVTVLAPGSTTLNVTAEGTTTPGEDELHLTGDIQILPAEIATGQINFPAVA